MKVTSKINNAQLLLQNKNTSHSIPLIHILTPANLLHVLTKAPFAYIKPDDSAQGKGIIRVDQQNNGRYMLRSRDTKESSIHEDFESLWEALNHAKRQRRYIIQQGILSTTHEGNPFDIRVHLSRINGTWIIAGIVGRVADKESIVTNAYSGGVSMYVHTILTEHMNLSSPHALQIIQQLKKLSLDATITISNRYRRWGEFGLDIGLDQDLHPWIYEINITPGGLVFQNLDRASYQRILYYHKRAR